MYCNSNAIYSHVVYKSWVGKDVSFVPGMFIIYFIAMQSSKASTFDCETPAYQTVHTPHLVFLALSLCRHILPDSAAW